MGSGNQTVVQFPALPWWLKAVTPVPQDPTCFMASVGIGHACETQTYVQIKHPNT